MDITYISAAGDTPFRTTKLSTLINAILDPYDPSEGIGSIGHLGSLLLLSDHPALATTLITTLHHRGAALIPASSYTTPSAPSFYPRHFENLWLANPNLRPVNSIPISLASAQWGKYREANRTGWMKEHCGLREPSDPYCWQKSDDPAMLAMCARLLSKNTTEGMYPSKERMREALAASLKLYAQPQKHVSEVTTEDYRNAKRDRKWRHSYLLYRRLVVDLAIRVGELETAAEVMMSGLRIDGSVEGGLVDDYLFVPGIWNVLPLLAKSGKEWNPYYIAEEDAKAMVVEIEKALEVRATQGRQRKLAPEKVGWEELLNRLKAGAWKVNKSEYRALGCKCADDILYSPASENDIAAAEAKVGDLPADFKEMVRIANGFLGGYHFLDGGIAGIQNISFDNGDHYYFNSSDFDRQGLSHDEHLDIDIVRVEPGNDECDGFIHYFIPPAKWQAKVIGREVEEGEYQFWHWASWMAGIQQWSSVSDWVASLVEKVEGMVERGEKQEWDGEEEEESEKEDDDWEKIERA